MAILRRGKGIICLMIALFVLLMGGTVRAEGVLYLDNMAAVMSTISHKGALATCSGGVILDRIPGIEAQVTMAIQESKDDGKTWTNVKSKTYDKTTKSEAYSFQYYMTPGRCYQTIVVAQASRDGVPGRPAHADSDIIYY